MFRSAICTLLLVGTVGWPALARSDDLDAAAQLPEIEYLYEGITVRGNDHTRDRFFANLLGLEPGERVSVEALDRFRRQLLATGFFSQVETRLLEGTRPETVLVDVNVREQNTLVVNQVFFGVSADTPIWGGLDLAETNLLGTGLTLAGAFVASGNQGAVRVNLGDPIGALGLPIIWTVEGRYASARGTGPSFNESEQPVEAAFEYSRLGGRVGLGVRLWSALGAHLDYRIEGLDFAYVDRFEPRPPTGIQPGTSLLSNLALALDLDLRDRPVMPTRGHRVGLVLEGGAPPIGSDYRYLRLTGQYQSAFWLGGGHVLRLEATGGALWSDDGRAPFFDGFYVGDITDLAAARNLELQFTDRRTLDLLGNGADRVTYGDLFGRLELEWAYAIHPVFGEASRVEIFASAGVFAIDQGPWAIGRPAVAVTEDEDEELSGLHPDLTMNLGLRARTSIGYFGFSLGGALSLAPLN